MIAISIITLESIRKQWMIYFDRHSFLFYINCCIDGHKKLKSNMFNLLSALIKKIKSSVSCILRSIFILYYLTLLCGYSFYLFGTCDGASNQSRATRMWLVSVMYVCCGVYVYIFLYNHN